MSLDKEIKQKEKELKELKLKNKTIKDLKSTTTIKCCGSQAGRGCGKNINVKDIELIQTYWYEGAWGCTGGDTWHAGETNFICPKCGKRNRPCWNKEFDFVNMDFGDIKYNFKNITEEYER